MSLFRDIAIVLHVGCSKDFVDARWDLRRRFLGECRLRASTTKSNEGERGANHAGA